MNTSQKGLLALYTFKRRHVNWNEHGIKVETVQYNPVNLVGQDSTKIVYSALSSLKWYTTDVNTSSISV